VITYGIDSDQAQRLISVIGDVPKSIRRELKTAVNATAKQTRSSMNKTVREKMIVKVDAVNRVLKIKSKATDDALTASVQLSKEGRIPLKEFGARQTKKGVSYRINKQEGRKVAAGAFQGPKLGQMKVSWRGHVFKRLGKTRLPIAKLFGPSPWGVFVVGEHVQPTVVESKVELKKQIERRIRFLTLKANGGLRGKQK
jgi:hypothetical protein